MGTKMLHVEVSDTLYDRFYQAATDKKGKWRGSKQSAGKALQTVVEAALLQFLDSLEEPDLAARMIEVLKH